MPMCMKNSRMVQVGQWNDLVQMGKFFLEVVPSYYVWIRWAKDAKCVPSDIRWHGHWAPLEDDSVYCRACGMCLNGPIHWQDDVIGKKHKKYMKEFIMYWERGWF